MKKLWYRGEVTQPGGKQTEHRLHYSWWPINVFQVIIHETVILKMILLQTGVCLLLMFY